MQRPQDRSPNTAGYEPALYLRIRSEFVEMPGLRLTLPQASRLFNLERTECARMLGVLVEMRVLSMRGHMFVRAGSA